MDEEIGVQEEQVERLRSIQAFQRRRVESMTVWAPVDGVLQEGDRILLTDKSRWDDADRVRIE